jgi:hypothetical protein
MTKAERLLAILEAKEDAIAFYVAVDSASDDDLHRLAERAEGTARRAWNLAGDDEELMWHAQSAQGYANGCRAAARRIEGC